MAEAVGKAFQDGWRTNPIKTRLVKLAIQGAIGDNFERSDEILALVQNQNELI